MKNKTRVFKDAAGVKKAITLVELQKEYDQWKQSLHLFNSSINKSIKEIRLRKLASTVAQALVKSQQVSNRSRKKIEKEEDELYDRWKNARKRGNKFSEYAIKQLCNKNKDTSFNVRHTGLASHSPNKEEELRYMRLRNARELGNERSRKVRDQKTLLKAKENNSSSFDDTTTVCLKKSIYGNYYTGRNRLSNKDSIGEYDQEYQVLLLKCALFEKQHNDVSGFLQENIFRENFHLITHESSSSGSKSSLPVSSKEKDPDCLDYEMAIVTASINALLTEIILELHHKEIGIQVSEGNISNTSEKSCETTSANENMLQDPDIFVDFEKLYGENFGFKDTYTLSEDKLEFKDVEKDQLEFDDAKSNDFKETTEKIGDQV